ncbi:MAG: hypothetical protein O3B72_13950, partial [Proteobacteria bacterium]|nr:hypothetical protein [Pseudomonadota bacterium]
MKVILALMLALALPVATTTRAATAAEQACEGTTEEMLRCHAPEVKELLRQWVYAWGEGDTEAYLSLYNSIRSPRDGMSRDAWETNRRSRVTPE